MRSAVCRVFCCLQVVYFLCLKVALVLCSAGVAVSCGVEVVLLVEGDEKMISQVTYHSIPWIITCGAGPFVPHTPGSVAGTGIIRLPTPAFGCFGEIGGELRHIPWYEMSGYPGLRLFVGLQRQQCFGRGFVDDTLASSPIRTNSCSFFHVAFVWSCPTAVTSREV